MIRFKYTLFLERIIGYEVPTTVWRALAPRLPRKHTPDGSWVDSRCAVGMRRVTCGQQL